MHFLMNEKGTEDREMEWIGRENAVRKQGTKMKNKKNKETGGRR